MKDGPLDLLTGYVILDLTQYLSGPMCTARLAQLGAEVLKVEPPETGDGNRHQPPFVSKEGIGDVQGGRRSSADIGLAFLKRNGGKKSVCLDLKSERGHKVLGRLISHADVVIHNFRPGVAERLRVDETTLRRYNTDLVYCNIDGLGQYAASGEPRGIIDISGQALSGLMGMTGFPSGPPTRAGAPVADQAAGLFAVVAILAALLRRDGRSMKGKGDAVSVSMVGALSALVWDEHLDVYWRSGLSMRQGNSTPRIAPVDTYETGDGKYVAVSAVSAHEWVRLCRAIGLPELSRGDWEELVNRVRDKDEIDRLIRRWVKSNTRDQVTEILDRYGCTSAPVYEVEDILADARFQEAYLSRVEDPSHGELDALTARFPVMVNGTQPRKPIAPAPRLGQHTLEVLCNGLDMKAEEIDDLLQAGVIQTDAGSLTDG